jgi:membrane protease YdiL (CAAX protease family)
MNNASSKLSTAMNDGRNFHSDLHLEPYRSRIELGVFLFLILPSMVFSILPMTSSIGFPVLAVSIIFRDIGLLALVAFFVWQQGLPLENLGWRWAKGGWEVLVGVALFIPLLVVASGFDAFLKNAGLSGAQIPMPSVLLPKGSREGILATALVIVVAIAEETIFRGYLLLRLRSFTQNSVAAVMISATIFAMGHGYEGEAGMITVGLMGILFALIYRWRMSLIAPVVLHFLFDFAAIVVAPLARNK